MTKPITHTETYDSSLDMDSYAFDGPFISDESRISQKSDWPLAVLGFIGMRSEIREAFGIQTDISDEDQREERLIGDAFMMAKRAVRIARAAGGSPIDYIVGNPPLPMDEVKERAVAFISFVEEIIPENNY